MTKYDRKVRDGRIVPLLPGMQIPLAEAVELGLLDESEVSQVVMYPRPPRSVLPRGWV